MLKFLCLIAVASIPSSYGMSIMCLAQFRLRGCFNQYKAPFNQMVMLKNMRDDIIWDVSGMYHENWRRLVCSCASMAKNNGYKLFSMRHWGECMGLKGMEWLDIKSKQHNLCSNDEYKTCFIGRDEICMGHAHSDALYSVEEMDMTTDPTDPYGMGRPGGPGGPGGPYGPGSMVGPNAEGVMPR